MPRKSDAYSSDLNGVPPFLSARKNKITHQTLDQDHTESWKTAEANIKKLKHAKTENVKRPSQQYGMGKQKV